VNDTHVFMKNQIMNSIFFNHTHRSAVFYGFALSLTFLIET